MWCVVYIGYSRVVCAVCVCVECGVWGAWDTWGVLYSVFGERGLWKAVGVGWGL